ncbi:MAG: MOSC domain-containing protein [Dermatophilaceae bacterium]
MGGVVRSVNTGRMRALPGRPEDLTGIDKHPADEPVEVRDPGTKRDGCGSGLVGDHIHDRRHHGGSDQAVYAVAREELDHWGTVLGRELRDGMFGENLTTDEFDVDGSLVGEVWRVGDVLRLQVRGPRIPCETFAGHMGEPRWVKRFTERGRTGAYLKVLTPGPVRAGDPIAVESRPAHEVTVPLMFRALTTERSLLPRLADVGDDLSEEGKRHLEQWRRRRDPSS